MKKFFHFRAHNAGLSQEKPVRKLRARTGLWKLFAIFMVIVLFIAGAILVYFSHWFALSTVEVKGAQLVSSQQIIAQSRLRSGVPLVRINEREVAKNISSSLAPIRKTVVTKKFPHTIVIQVIERIAVAITRQHEVIDAYGVVFGHKYEKQKLYSPDFLPLIDTPTPGVLDDITHDALQAYLSLPQDIKENVVVIKARSISSISFTLGDKRIIVYGTDTDIEQKNYVLQGLLTRPGKVYIVSSPSLVVIK